MADDFDFDDVPRKRRKKRSLLSGCLGCGLVIGVVCFGLVLAGVWKISNRPTPTQHVPTSYVIHIGNAPDGYFKELAPAKNAAGVETKWTTKRDAKRLSKEEAEKVVEQMQRIAKLAGMHAPLTIEPAD